MIYLNHYVVISCNKYLCSESWGSSLIVVFRLFDFFIVEVCDILVFNPWFYNVFYSTICKLWSIIYHSLLPTHFSMFFNSFTLSGFSEYSLIWSILPNDFEALFIIIYSFEFVILNCGCITLSVPLVLLKTIHNF